MWNSLKQYAGWIAAVVLVLMGFFLGRDCGSKSRTAEIQNLSAKLAESERTVQLKTGLYATEVVEVSRLDGLLDGSRTEVSALKKQLSDSNAQLLSTQQLVVSWKHAYDGLLTAHQGDGGKSPDGPIERKRVDFSGKLGPIIASGYTLTDPAVAHLKLEQTDPLLLTVSVARNRDGTWSSYVTSSDKDLDVRVNLAGVDPGVTSPGWRQRIYFDAGLYAIGGKGGSVGVSYHFDRLSLGLACQDVGGIGSCGATMGLRIFR